MARAARDDGARHITGTALPEQQPPPQHLPRAIFQKMRMIGKRLPSAK